MVSLIPNIRQHPTDFDKVIIAGINYSLADAAIYRDRIGDTIEHQERRAREAAESQTTEAVAAETTAADATPAASSEAVAAPAEPAAASSDDDDDEPALDPAIAAKIEGHQKWLKDEEGGERADLSGANLSGANLSGADLSGADLSGANLSWANLSWADLSEIKNDLILAILRLPDEIPFLRKALVDGKIDGSTYTGECCCLAGTMCHAKGMDFQKFKTAGLMPIANDSLRERWFLHLAPGHTPENNQVAKVTLEWIDEALSLVNLIRSTAASVGATEANESGTGPAVV